MAGYPYILHGDAEAAMVDILMNHTPELAAYAGDTPFISTDLIGFTELSRWVMVTMEGGSAQWPIATEPRIDFEFYAERRSVALDIGQICVASIFRASGNYTGNGLFLEDVQTEMGLTRVPDKETSTPRYLYSLRLTILPLLG